MHPPKVDDLSRKRPGEIRHSFGQILIEAHTSTIFCNSKPENIASHD
jgi:hypothetical protein